jgi:hypothetical protein
MQALPISISDTSSSSSASFQPSPFLFKKKYERSEFNKFAKQKKPHLTA